jgi:osmotically-inducible protein OsmY
MTSLVFATVVGALVAAGFAPVFADDTGRRDGRSGPSAAQGGQTSSVRNSEGRFVEDLAFVLLAERAWVGGDFDISVQRGTATLTGTVPSEQTKRRIVRIVRGTPGVVDVRDQLRVDPAAARATSPVPDAQLAQRVAQRIAAAVPGAKAGEDWWLTGWRVEGPDNRWSFTVEADDGTVWLDGEVPRLDVVRQAIDAARRVEGVTSVRSAFELERRYAGYPAYGYPYYAHPWADPDYYFVFPSASPRSGERAGTQEHRW